MVILAKVGLGLCGTIVLAGAYTFRQGVLRVDADTRCASGSSSHVHFWIPAAVVPMALHLVPRSQLMRMGDQGQEWMPVMRALSKELEKYPNTEFVEIQDGNQHAVVRTHNGKLQIDVDSPDEKVHVVCPVATIESVTEELASASPGA